MRPCIECGYYTQNQFICNECFERLMDEKIKEED